MVLWYKLIISSWECVKHTLARVTGMRAPQQNHHLNILSPTLLPLPIRVRIIIIYKNNKILKNKITKKKNERNSNKNNNNNTNKKYKI